MVLVERHRSIDFSYESHDLVPFQCVSDPGTVVEVKLDDWIRIGFAEDYLLGFGVRDS